MKIFLLVVLLIPIFIFQAFIFVDSINMIKVPSKAEPAGVGRIHFHNEKSSRKSNIRIVK